MEYAIRSFDDRYWWPVLHWDDVPISQETLVRRARRPGDEDFSHLLNSQVPAKVEPEASDEYFERVMVKETLGSDFDERRLLVDCAADDLAFCDGKLLASAGPSLWYAIEIFDRHWEISPSSSTPDLRNRIKLPGCSVHHRRKIAAKGAVRDCWESGIPGHLLLAAGKLRQTIEVLEPDAPRMATELCAREFSRSFPEVVDLRHRRKFYGKLLPTLAAALDQGDFGERLPYRRILEELVRDGRSVTPFIEKTIELTAEILARLKQATAPEMAQEDDDALSSLALFAQEER